MAALEGEKSTLTVRFYPYRDNIGTGTDKYAARAPQYWRLYRRRGLES